MFYSSHSIHRKTNLNSSKHHRHRSYTISSKITPTEQNPIDTTSKGNWCGYDSMLHAKICSTNNIISNPVLAAHTSKLLHNYNSNNNNSTNSPHNGNNNNNNRNSRSRHRHYNEFPISGSPQVQGYTKLMSTQNNKLNTTLLNQLNPQLTHEQKLTRTINHVEKWLADEHVTAATSLVTSNIFDSKNINCKENNFHNNKNDDNLNNATNAIDKLKESEKITKKINETASPSKKVFNKEILIARKTTPKSSLSSSQRNSSNSDTQVKAGAPIVPNNNVNVNTDAKDNIMEYASIPIVFDPSQSECENLLRASSDESSSQVGMTDNASLTTIHRYVHIHHHYYHH